MKYEKYFDLFSYRRFKTRPVKVGEFYFGDDNPIRIQSMTSTNTNKIKETVEQSLRIVKAGGELVRITAQGIKEAENLKNIKQGISNAGIKVPLAADIHFNPKAAFVAAKIVEKVRINPGNFVDRNRNDGEFTEEEYKLELKKIEDTFVQLLNLCRQHKTALRIGVNHGSLSERIMNRFGDTPLGMVESAMEFLRICVKEEFFDVIVSLKSSNTRIMIQSNRLMLAKMHEEGMSFPLHLGVTEAGEGEDGRIKSAVGIGTLLADGIGDTIRVSLTEPPENEIPVAKKLVNFVEDRKNHKPIDRVKSIPIDFFSFLRRESFEVVNIGGVNVPVVIANEMDNKRLKPDFIYLGNKFIVSNLSNDYKYIVDENIWEQQEFESNSVYPLYFSINNYYLSDKASKELNFIKINASAFDEGDFQKIKNFKNLVLILESSNENKFADLRACFFRLINEECKVPVIVKLNYVESDLENIQLKSACESGGLFIDGLADGLWIENKGTIQESQIINTSFGILQASRVRFSKTEYISCPGCGRTLFDLQTTTKKIRELTSHLKNLKIGIMGCIVNGPGEMADADYGYVGAGPGKITLYKNKEVIKKNIPEKDAVEELIQLIKDNGDWVE